MTTDIPLRTCHLHLKQVNASTLTHDQRLALSVAFPEYSTSELKASQDLLGSHLKATVAGIDEWVEKERSHKTSAPVVFVKAEVLTRRYSGGDVLPRGRYHTVAIDDSGNDAGTLKDELFAYYRSSDLDFFYLWDTTLEQDTLELAKTFDVRFDKSVVVGFPFLSGEQLKILGFENHDVTHRSGTFIGIPVQLSTIVVNEVFDLREPEAAAWFAAHFGRGGSLQVKPRISKFEEILPSLLYQQLGGGSFSETVGMELRQLGAKGFVFPSVRANPYVEVADGKVTRFGGWNYVDYSDLPASDCSLFVDSEPTWSRYVNNFIAGKLYEYKDIRMVFESKAKASWRIDGLEEKNKAIKEFRILVAFANALGRVSKSQVFPLLVWLFDIWIVDSKAAYETIVHINNMLYFNSKESSDYLTGKSSELRSRGDSASKALDFIVDYKDIIFMEWLWKKLK